ncbi:PD-(D/E)XK nuclease family protein, partial [Planktothrix sp. FACHB-1355]
MRLSQRHLNLLSTCPRKFQHTYLEQLGSLTTPEQLERINWGSHFHLLMQQRELGLPIESIVQEDAQMQRWLTALVSAAPEILTPSFNNKA